MPGWISTKPTNRLLDTTTVFRVSILHLITVWHFRELPSITLEDNVIEFETFYTDANDLLIVNHSTRMS